MISARYFSHLTEGGLTMISKLSHPMLIILASVLFLCLPALACTVFDLSSIGSSNETDVAFGVNATINANRLTEVARSTPTPSLTPANTPAPTASETPINTPAPISSPTQVLTPTPTGLWVSEIVCASEITPDNIPVDPGNSLKRGIKRLYGVFEYSGIEKGVTVSYYWALNGKEFVSFLRQWDEEVSGTSYAYALYTDGESLDIGLWTLTIFVDNKLVAKGTCKIVP
jgi:hypothetical protein